MSDYAIITHSKMRFNPLAPNPKDVRIADIAHALSLMTRANGHIKWFYSVAQHCINCALEAQARGYAENIQLACLLHDASEAYLSDITRPVKAHLPQYLKLEEQLQSAVHQAFGIDLAPDERAHVKQIDDALLWHEFLSLMDEHLDSPEPFMHSKPDFSLRPFMDVEMQFLNLFSTLTGAEKSVRCVGIDGAKGGWVAASIQGDRLDIRMF